MRALFADVVCPVADLFRPILQLGRLLPLRQIASGSIGEPDEGILHPG
jgi:hypothetical protein